MTKNKQLAEIMQEMNESFVPMYTHMFPKLKLNEFFVLMILINKERFIKKRLDVFENEDGSTTARMDKNGSYFVCCVKNDLEKLAHTGYRTLYRVLSNLEGMNYIACYTQYETGLKRLYIKLNEEVLLSECKLAQECNDNLTQGNDNLTQGNDNLTQGNDNLTQGNDKIGTSIKYIYNNGYNTKKNTLYNNPESSSSSNSNTSISIESTTLSSNIISQSKDCDNMDYLQPPEKSGNCENKEIKNRDEQELNEFISNCEYYGLIKTGENPKPILRHATKLLEMGYTYHDMEKVLGYKISDDWFVDNGYYRPKTLFNPDKFEKYLLEANAPSKTTTAHMAYLNPDGSLPY